MGVSDIRKIRHCQGHHNINLGSFFRRSISKSCLELPGPGDAFHTLVTKLSLLPENGGGFVALKLWQMPCFPLEDGKGRLGIPASWSSCNAYVIKSFITLLAEEGMETWFKCTSILWHIPPLLWDTTHLKSRNKGTGSAQDCNLHKCGDFVFQGVLWECTKRQRVCKCW